MTSDAILPFSALVAQQAMKRALILAAIHPGLGGVLIRGSKGSAKSTAVRSLATLLPPIAVYEGDPFRRAPEEDVPGWPLPENAQLVKRPVALVNLPIGATDDRVVGSLNFERALATGARAFEPGLLAAAHRGILYIDEVNLLGDHLVDLLLDAAAMGVNHVEREGLAFRHPARFVLVGTMNPEEGDLRPQLLDRFGLVVDVEPMTDPRARAEVVRRRLAFETDPSGFRDRWAEADLREGERIAEARRLLPKVVVPDAVLEAVCTRCALEGADGLRADLTIHKAASALAAYEGRTTVSPADADAVAELALAHRRTSPPPPPQQPSPEDGQGRSERPPRPQSPRADRPGSGQTPQEEHRRPARSEADRDQNGPIDDSDSEDSLIPPAAEPRAISTSAWRLAKPQRGGVSGQRGRPSAHDRRGPYLRAAVPVGPALDPALDATLRAAAPWQQARGRADGRSLIILPSDLRVKVRTGPAQHLILFVVDASRSMGARERMRQTKAAVLSLLVDAYQKRDRVGLITFRGQGARLSLSPTRSVRVAARHLVDLPIGGSTPLTSGLALASRVVALSRLREATLTPFVVLLTDGRANVPLEAGRHPEAEAVSHAQQLACAGVSGLVIDTEGGPVRLRRAQALASAWGVDCIEIDTLKGSRLPQAVRRALFARSAS
jgi:magnesium chelatase subunit D